MNTQAFTTVQTTRTQIEAGLLISILAHAGLHPLDLETFGHFSLAGTDIDYAVRVPSEEATEAKEVLNAYSNRAA